MSKTTLRKHQRQLAQQAKQQEKLARREQRKVEKLVHPRLAGQADPDLAGMVPGPQRRRDEEIN